MMVHMKRYQKMTRSTTPPLYKNKDMTLRLGSLKGLLGSPRIQLLRRHFSNNYRGVLLMRIWRPYVVLAEWGSRLCIIIKGKAQ